VSPDVTADAGYYKGRAADFSKQQLSVDFFLFNPNYADVATLGSLSRYTSGQVYWYSSGGSYSPEADGARFQKDLINDLTRTTAFEAVMRVRATKGVAINSFYGNFFIRGADLLEAAGWLAQALGGGALSSWSLDLIQGLPGQDLGHWRRQLRQAIALAPPHLSVYDLTLEPGTVFAQRHDRGQLQLPDADLGADLMELTWAELSAAGYGHYEISNYALPGHASRHNRVYWSGAGWWGFGMGATAAPWGERLARPRTREAYADWLAQPGSPPASAGEACPGMPLDERLLVGLRRREGVSMPALLAQAGLGPAALAALHSHLESWIGEGLLRIEGPRWRLSDPAGLALSNGVLRELLAWWQEQE
jgi:oxygen-independent coproporphyrinogen-3 oxidase